MAVAKKPEPPKAPLNPSEFSTCHGVRLIGSPLLHLQRDGSTIQIARVLYCLREREGESCHKPQAIVQKSKQWPLSLTQAEVLRLCHHDGPEYWLESGFHIYQWEGRWLNLRTCAKWGGLPPWMRGGEDSEEFQALLPDVQSIVRRLKMAHENGHAVAFEPKPMPVPAQEKPDTALLIARMNAEAEQDRKSLAAGEKEEMVWDAIEPEGLPQVEEVDF